MVKDDIWNVGQAVFGSHSRPRTHRTVRTSHTHPLRIAAISVGENGGKIGMTICPGKADPSSVGGPWARDLNADITVIRKCGASSVLTLLEPHEFDLLKVQGLPEAVRAAGLVWLHAPIPDVSVPGRQFDAAWKTIGPRLTEQLYEGRSVVVHCRGGLGRAGMVAAILLVMMGEIPRRAIDRVRGVRPGSIETAAQEAYVRAYGSGEGA